MEFIAKKYTVLMNNEPLEIKIKNDKVVNAKFMNKKVDLSQLNVNTLNQIKDNPSRVVNGNNLVDNKNFTATVSKMMSQKLETAIAKNDKKTLSRFARSELVPDNMKDNFLEAVNRPTGLRGLLISAANKTNNIFQKMAQKVDNYFDRVKENAVSNKSLDKYLDKYQMKEFNKAPPLKDLDLNQPVHKKLVPLAKEFVRNNHITELTDTKTSDKLLQDEFMKKAARLGLNPIEAKTALAQTVQANQTKEMYDINVDKLSTKENKLEDMAAIIKKLEEKIDVYAKKEAAPNQSLEDFKALTKGMTAVDKIDILLENKAYKGMSETQKLAFEDKVLVEKKDNIHEKAQEIKEISKVLVQPIKKNQEPEVTMDRNPTINFKNPNVKTEVMNTWKELQSANQKSAEPNRNFMNISAVAFGGVSEKSLNKWSEKAKANGVNPEIVEKFKEASIRNAKELEKAGILKQSTVGEFKFVDKYSQETLYNNIDKTVEQIETKNKGTEVFTLPEKAKEELIERVKDLSSEKSFERLIDKDGKINTDELHKFSEHLQTLSLQVKLEEKGNNVNIDKNDLKLAEKQQESSQEQQRG
jgi:hypothetical protein